MIRPLHLAGFRLRQIEQDFRTVLEGGVASHVQLDINSQVSARRLALWSNVVVAGIEVSEGSRDSVPVSLALRGTRLPAVDI